VNAISLTDRELIRQFLKGNQSGIEILFERYKVKVYNYILLIVRDKQLAEDILQDTFIKVIRSLKQGKYKDDGKFVSWVMRIAHNLVIDFYRKAKQLQTVPNLSYQSDRFNSVKYADDTIEDVMINTQISNDVKKLITELPEDQQQIIYLRHYEGLSFKEIADLTNVSINTALGRMRYAIINMRRIMEKKKLNLSKV